MRSDINLKMEETVKKTEMVSQTLGEADQRVGEVETLSTEVNETLNQMQRMQLEGHSRRKNLRIYSIKRGSRGHFNYSLRGEPHPNWTGWGRRPKRTWYWMCEGCNNIQYFNEPFNTLCSVQCTTANNSIFGMFPRHKILSKLCAAACCVIPSGAEAWEQHIVLAQCHALLMPPSEPIRTSLNLLGANQCSACKCWTALQQLYATNSEKHKTKTKAAGVFIAKDV